MRLDVSLSVPKGPENDRQSLFSYLHDRSPRRWREARSEIAAMAAILSVR